jgi:hypothetical protein
VILEGAIERDLGDGIGGLAQIDAGDLGAGVRRQRQNRKRVRGLVDDV